MAEDKGYSNIYTIPPNYTDSGKLLGGLLEMRNTAEAGILLILVGYPELAWLHLPITAKVTVMTVTLLPLGVFALMGLGGDSLLQYVTHMVLYWIRRRKLHFRRVGYRYGTVKCNPHPASKRPGNSSRKGTGGVRAGLHPTQRNQKRHH